MTVVDARVDYLDLEDLNNFELGSQDLWDTLTKKRQTFHQGEQKETKFSSSRTTRGCHLRG